MTRRPDPEPPCPNEAEHTAVTGYAEASRMCRTHQQSQCPACGLHAIWTPLPPGSLVVCWRCEKRNVDPAALGGDDEPICPQCRVEMAQEREAERQARVVRRWADAT